MTLKQLVPMVDYLNDGLWEITDPLTGKIPIEGPGCTARRIRFNLDPSKPYCKVTTVGTESKTLDFERGLTQVGNIQYKGTGEWLLDYYVYAKLP